MTAADGNQAAGAAPRGSLPEGTGQRGRAPWAEAGTTSFPALEVCFEAVHGAAHGPLPETVVCRGPRWRAIRPVRLGHGTPVS